MKIYLVGGAVRDKLLRKKIQERDWVVVGATPQEMFARGFRKVGRDFPVFLHPKTHEEYALARTERKTGKGYTQFQCYFDPSVTLEEDLKRRDLTINAMAQTTKGELIDPYGGANDLKHKYLRHVSEAFAEDPVRILRVARFAARFGNFKVHPKTTALMRKMLATGEVDALVPERVWQELERALGEKYPEKFFIVLANCGVLSKLFPAVVKHKKSAINNLKQTAQKNNDRIIRFAALCANLPRAQIKDLCQRYRVPHKYLDLVLLVAKYQKPFKHALKLSARQLLNLLTTLDVYRRPERLKQCLSAVLGLCPKMRSQKRLIQKAYQKTAAITGKMLIAQNIEPAAIPKTLRKLRLCALKKTFFNQ